MVFAMHINSGSFKEEFLFCSLQLTTKASDILEKLSSFFNQKIFCGIISVGAVQLEHQLSLGQFRIPSLCVKASS